MKKILLVLLLILPFSTFASSLDEIQNLQIEIKGKSINGLSLYNSIEKTIEKKTKGDNNKKLALYKKLLSQTEKSNNSVYKKLTIILKYGVNELESFGNIENYNGVINKINENNNTQGNSIQNAINLNQNSSISDGNAYYGNEGVIRGQGYFSDKEIEESGQKVYEAKSEYEKQLSTLTLLGGYNQGLFDLQTIKDDLSSQESLINSKYIGNDNYNLVQKEVINDYNNYLSIFKDGGAVLYGYNIKQKETIIRVLTSKYASARTEDEFVKSMGYRYENGVLKYYKNLNTFKAELTQFNYLKNNNTQGNSIQNAIDSNQNSSISDGTAYYGNDGVIKGQGSFSDKEIEDSGKKVYEAKSEYEKQLVGVTFIGLVKDNLYNKDGIIEQLKYQENLINTKYRTEKFNLVINDIIKDYNLYLSIFKNGGLVSNYDFLNGKGDLVEGYINMGDLINSDKSDDIKFLRSLGYKGMNGKIVYDESLNTFKNELKDFEYLK